VHDLLFKLDEHLVTVRPDLYANPLEGVATEQEPES
jgi:hypothetical protein